MRSTQKMLRHSGKKAKNWSQSPFNDYSGSVAILVQPFHEFFWNSCH